ncbi:zinc finger protein 862-like, partial [Anoplopoma fimbria]
MAGSSLFRTGNPNLKRDAVVKHSESVRHSRCRDVYINRTQPNNPGTVEAAVGRQLAISNQDALRQLKVKFNIAYVIAKEEIAFTKFGPMIALHHKNGLNINPTYDNDVRCAEMVGQIAEGIKDTLAAQLQAARYLAVLIDGDTDISNTECEIVYVRFVEDGRPVTRLVGQQALLHAHAQGVLAGTNAAFDALGRGTCDWKAKCVAFGADGAKVNMGVHRGVSALLKQAAGQHVIPIHCMPHRLELAILNLQRNETMVAKVYDLLHLVWKTYHQSPKSRRELNLIGKEL